MCVCVFWNLWEPGLTWSGSWKVGQKHKTESHCELLQCCCGQQLSLVAPVKLAGLKVWKCATECTRALMITVRYSCFMVQLSIKDLRLVVACNSLLNVRVTMLYARRYSTLDSRSRIISLALSSLFSKFTSHLHHGKQWYIYVNCKLIFLFR